MKNLIEKLLDLLNRIGKDKYQHFILGAVIALVALLTALPLGAWWRGFPLLASLLAVISAAVLKERRFDTAADLNDILSTLAGGAVVWAVYLAV